MGGERVRVVEEKVPQVEGVWDGELGVEGAFVFDSVSDRIALAVWGGSSHSL